MLKNIIIFLSIILLCNANSSEIKVIFKIENEIVTSQDVKNEINYLTSLNLDLEKLNKEQIFTTAKNSLIREKIKKNEIDRVYNPDYIESFQNKRLIDIIDKFYKNLGYSTLNEFKIYLESKNIKFSELQKKFAIELYWNQLIFDKYNKSVNIDRDKINSKLKSILESSEEQIEFNLSEIVFIDDKKNSKYDEVLKSINQIGFKETALLFSISESAKFGGNIGWINQNQISDKIFNLVKNLEIGNFSEPIITAGGKILLKVNEKKTSTKKLNKEDELKKIVSAEKNRILSEYSIIYFKKIESRTYVEKF